MDYLFSCWDRLKKEIEEKFIFIFLDYDGTLAPIAQEPAKAVISKNTKDILRKLSKNPYCKLAIISGRALKDIKNRIGLKGIIYVANHGLEMEGPAIRFRSLVPSGYAAVLKKIKQDLVAKLSQIKGVIIEDKGLVLSLHYRMVTRKYIPLVKTVFHETIIHYLVTNKIKINSGKKVLEVKPPLRWNKGHIVSWLCARRRFVLGRDAFLPIYIGDDLTDEDAFKVVKNNGLAIFVGEPIKTSHARYYLRNPSEVMIFLKKILALKKG
jgi:trehalose-phosphatase